MKILVINGPNLNFLGIREPGVYGEDSLEKINKELSLFAEKHSMQCDFFQSNVEGEIINELQRAHNEK